MKKSNSGRVPMSQKEQSSNDVYQDDESILAVDPELRKEIESQGLALRWINAGKYRSGGNFHKSGWRAYQRKTSAQGSLDFSYGTSPEGYIIRNDMLLAVKPVEAYERKRSQIKSKADLMAGNEKTRAQELREQMRASGLGGKVFEGYEGNGDGSDE